MNILLTLDSGMGANLGPNFNLTSNSGHIVTPNTATRAELIAGKSISISPDGAVNIFVTSTGTCTNTLVLNIAGITTSTTSTSTSTSTTAAPTSTTTSTSTTSTSTSTSTTTLAAIPVILAYSNIDGPTACYKFTAPIPDTATYYLTPNGTLADGNTLYVDGVYSNIVSDGFYSNGVDYWEVNVAASGGVLSNGTPCPQTTTTTTSTSTTSTSTSTTSTSTSTTSTSTTSTSTSTTTAAPTSTTTSTSSTTSTTTIPLPPGETSTTTTSTTEPPTTTSTSTTTTTTTAAPQCNYDGLSIVCDGTTTTTTTEPPTTTTTTSGGGGTTTTTTAGINYISYPADKYGCNAPNCGSFVAATEIAFPDTFTVTINKWYSSLNGDGYAYQLTSTTPSAGPGLIMQQSTFNTCGLACSV